MKTGRLELYLGSMFSGKSSKLINIYKKWKLCNYNPLVINYSADTRYSPTADKLITHDKNEIPCIHNISLRNIFQPLINNKTITNQDYDIIIINEGQFFEDLYIWCELLVNTYNKHIYIAALNGDFEKKPFEQISKLIPEADVIEKLHAICSGCKDGTPASFSFRVTNEKDRILIGSNNYTPLCRKCYINKIHFIKCNVCDNPAIYRCDACETTHYCSVECQKLHWSEHQADCIVEID